MQGIFSNERKFTGWRDCWIALAEAEMELGLPQIKPEYVQAMRETRKNVPYERAAELERKLRHDVMAHVHAWKEQLEPLCPGAGGIIHLGATSMYPCDNTELLQMRDGIDLVTGKVINVLRRVKPFAEQYAATPCLALTHYQPAQPTTYGKRICEWMHNLVEAFWRLTIEKTLIKGRGVKGTTGTQDSFLKLFDEDAEKVKKLDELVSEKLGFEDVYVITTQTYPRIVDYTVLSALAGIAVAAKKTGGDIRLLQGAKELSEPFRKSQIGSSAMAYKRNPMRSERMCGLARHVIAAPQEAASYASEQWLERTLDDSAERRILIADTFLGTDSVLNLMLDIFSPDTEKQNGFRIHPAVALKRLAEEMPFMATEEVMMEAVKAGADRQEVHEIIRKCSLEARQNIDNGRENNMVDLMAEEAVLGVPSSQRDKMMDPMRYIGTCRQQVEMFLEDVDALLEEHDDVPHMDGGVKV